MAPKFSPHGQAAALLVGDGEWHQIADVISHMVNFVPHGKAIRTWQRDHPSPRGTVGVDAQVRGGRLALCRDIVRNNVRDGRWEKSGDQVRQVTP